MAHNQRKERSRSGMSIVELLVSALIIGFVIAGLSQALFVNLAWFRVLECRLENGMAARLFLRKLAEDVRTSYQLETNSCNNVTLVLNKQPEPPFIAPAQLLDSQAYSNTQVALVSSRIVYTVEPDTQPGYFRIRYQNSANNDNRIILTGILGPLSKATGLPAIFQYVSKEAPCNQSNSADPLTGSVIVNLELRRKLFGHDTGAFGGDKSTTTEKSAIALRSEFLLRNSMLHGDN